MSERMDLLGAVLVAQGTISANARDYYAAWQRLVDNGCVWSLEGWFGRRAQELLLRGDIRWPIKPLPHEERESTYVPD